ncbi:MAG: tetratricopeptide repeat protein [Hyphomonadaceae bacterium]
MLSAIAAAAVLGAASPAAGADSRLDDALASVIQAWDHARFQITDDDAQVAALRRVEAQAAALAQQYPGEAAPMLWQAAAMAAEADESGPGAALSLARRAKALLEAARAAAADRLTEAGIHTLLGVLYYEAPGFPIAFGDHRQAEANLRQAVALNPQSIEANYYLGDFLMERRRYGEAIAPLSAALNAPDRPGRAIADSALRSEARERLAHAQRRASQ